MYRYSMYHIATYSGSSSASSSGVQTSPAGGAPGRLAQRAAGLAGRGGDAATTGAAAAVCCYMIIYKYIYTFKYIYIYIYQISFVGIVWSTC